MRHPISNGGTDGTPSVTVPFLRQSTGLGSFISGALSAIGVGPCGGCQERAEALDKRLRLEARGEGGDETEAGGGWY